MSFQVEAGLVLRQGIRVLKVLQMINAMFNKLTSLPIGKELHSCPRFACGNATRGNFSRTLADRGLTSYRPATILLVLGEMQPFDNTSIFTGLAVSNSGLRSQSYSTKLFITTGY